MSQMQARPETIYRGYVFDLDGTIYIGEQIVPDAARVIATIRSAGARVVFVTNNPLELPEHYARKLRRLGIPADDGEVISSIDALVAYLHERAGGASLLTIAEPLVIDVLKKAGFRLTEDPKQADVVVVSFDRTLTYEKLRSAFLAVRAGARIVGTNPDAFCPTPDGGLPDCGAILAALEAATGKQADAVVGKPALHMARVALDRLGTSPSQTLLVGDRLETDIRMARRAGMPAALVLTGVSRADAVPESVDTPSFVLSSVAEVIPFDHEPTDARRR